MHFIHADEIWRRFPQLRALALVIRNVAMLQSDRVDTTETVSEICKRLDDAPEGDLPSIQAWRRTYAEMGLKPTQYRCAAEALLRRLRKDKMLPRLHPLIDLLNAESANMGIPIAAFDVAKVLGSITVRLADGTEEHRTFQSEIERPAPGEVVFADEANHAHSRRWVFRQSAASVVCQESVSVLVVAEALHDAAEDDLGVLKARLLDRAARLDLVVTELAQINPRNRRFDYAGC
ncbi:tRNA synthetase subunit beta [Aureimonas ureilytica]|uniref:tRNA synthetase subunit beta n=1 Tax=Aureimonas ureilytica TaxID=401562 RepID=A0A175RI20_9HYPH|nr:phenylalanine--tRNA ligase beta subunit-related protein [Aureimonas ureilytica]KTR02524.1 tRNA synthetase subunit beta [Aureimonas ureilytica]